MYAKSLIILSATLFAVHAMAETPRFEEIVGPNGEVSARITEPRYPGTDFQLKFNKWEKEDGVCILLGYARAITRSTRTFLGDGGRRGTSQRVILLNAKGEIEKMENTNNHITEIVCLDKKDNPPTALKLTTIEKDELIHAESGYPVSAEDAEKRQGVCIYFGYARDLQGSAKMPGLLGTEFPERTIMLNADGTIDKMRSDLTPISEIVCISKAE